MTCTVVESSLDVIEGEIISVYKKVGTNCSKYIKLYSQVFEFFSITQRKGLKFSIPETIHDNGIAQEFSVFIAFILQEFLWQKSKTSRTVAEEDILRYYTTNWKDFWAKSVCLEKLTTRIVRRFNKEALDAEGNNKYSVLKVAMELWKDVVVKALHPKVSKALSTSINQQRKDSTISPCDAKLIIDSYKIVGAYGSQFEPDFREATIEYFTSESNSLIQQCTLPEYVSKVNLILENELNLIVRILPDSESIHRHMDICNKALVQHQLPVIVQNFKSAVSTNDANTLSMIYNFVKPLDEDSLKDIIGFLQHHIHKRGVQEMIDMFSTFNPRVPMAFVHSTLFIHDYFAEMISTTFKSDSRFLSALGKACKAFINQNVFTERHSRNIGAAKVLIKCTVSLLDKKTPPRFRECIDKQLDDLIKVLEFIDDPDSFKTAYTKLILSRLMYRSTSAANTVEPLMIQKLNQLWGWEYTQNLRQIYEKFRSADELNQEFRTWVVLERNNSMLPLILNTIKVLPVSLFPFKVKNTFHPPLEIRPIVDLFSKFYGIKNNKRKLTWCYEYSTANVTANCFNNSYNFKTSMYQMTIILLFNESLINSVGMMQNRTGLNMQILQSVLQTLVNARLLVILNNVPIDKLKEDSEITIAASYASPTLQVKISPHPINQSSEIRSEYNMARVSQENRKYQVRSAIVRILKKEKLLEHKQLIQKIKHQLQKNFIPPNDLIKMSIETLIDTDYIRRHPVKIDVYQYVP